MQPTPEDLPAEFTLSQRVDHEEKLSALLAHRERAAEVLHTQMQAELGYTPKPAVASLAALSRCDDARTLLKSRQALELLPLLGAIQREDQALLQKQTTLLTEASRSRKKRNPFTPSYGKVVFIAAIAINLLINFYVYPVVDEVAGSHPSTAPTTLQNFLAKDIATSLVCIAAILVFWHAIVYFRDELFARLSQIPHVGSLFSGNREMLNSSSKFAYILAELLDAGVPLAEALRCDGLVNAADSNLSRSIATTLKNQSSSLAMSSKRTNHLRELGDIYSYNTLIRHKKSELYATSSTLMTGLLVYWTATTLLALLAKAIAALT